MSDRATYRFLGALRGESASFGRVLEAVRAAEGITQQELGERLGVSRARVCDYEKGRRLVTPQVAAAIAKTFGFDPAPFIAFALEEALHLDGLDYRVRVAPPRRDPS